MRDLHPPKNIAVLEIACGMNKEDALALWLAQHSEGNVLDIGCGKGQRSKSIAVMVSRFNRTVYGIDWSEEHRINPKQKRQRYMRREIGSHAFHLDNVKVIDADPASLTYDSFQPIGIAVIDYDYSKSGLDLLSRSVLKAADTLGNPNTIVAWRGYSVSVDECNEVFRYVNSLDLANTFHFHTSQTVFKVFNPTERFREELRAIAVI